MMTERFHQFAAIKDMKKKQWIKPALKDVPIFFECTCYAAAI